MSLGSVLIEQRSAAQPIAWRDRDAVVTWGAFRSGIEALSEDISASPVERWIIVCADPVEFLAALFAVWHAGRTPVIPSNYQKESIIRACGPGDRVIEHVELSSSTHRPVRLTALDHQTSKAILYTSGTSGSPKVVVKTLFQFDSEVRSLEAQWGARVKGLPVVATVPHYHIYGLLFRLLWPVYSRRVFVSDELTMPDRLLSQIRDIGPVVLVSSPAHLARIPALIDLQDIKPYIAWIFSSGAPLPHDIAERYAREMGSAPIEVYGSTETGGIGWRQGGPLWTPFPSVDIRTSDAGTLEVRSPKTEGQDWAPTEDLVSIKDDGRFSISGRADRIVKVEGKRVSLDEMSARLNDHPWIDGSGIVFLERARTMLGAAVVLSREGIDQHARNGELQTIGQLKEHLAQWFEPVVLPRQWRFVSRLPTTDRGKAAMSGVLSLFAEDLDGPVVLSSDRTATVLEMMLFVPSSLIHFQGHFPDFPVVPGVLQIHWAAQHGMREFNVPGRFSGISKLKFHRVIVPNTELTLRVVAHDRKLAFSYTTREGIHSSGELEFK